MTRVFTLCLVTYTTILTFARSRKSHGFPSTQSEMLLYHEFFPKKKLIRTFGNYLEPRYIFGAGSLDE